MGERAARASALQNRPAWPNSWAVRGSLTSWWIGEKRRCVTTVLSVACPRRRSLEAQILHDLLEPVYRARVLIDDVPDFDGVKAIEQYFPDDV